MTMPHSNAFGKIRTGTWHSSAMFTESSKPTIAKNASEVAELTATSQVWSAVLISVSLLASPSPLATAYTPTAMMISRPDSSTMVSTTLALTDSPTPRKLTSAISSTNRTAINVVRRSDAVRPNVLTRYVSPNATAADDADVMPEHITANATMKVRNWILNARCVYSAAPAAFGYLP